MTAGAKRQAHRVGHCLHCENTIHRGIRGWLCILEDDFADRYLCDKAPDGKHTPLTTRDACIGLEGLLMGQGYQRPPKPQMERTTCAGCGHAIGWISSLQCWTDIFYDGDEFVSDPQATGTLCIPGGLIENFPTDYGPHSPVASFLRESLLKMKRDLA